MRLSRYRFVVILFLLAQGVVFALGQPDNVLVVRNGNSPVSISIASYYMSRRGIPAGNLVTVSTIDSSLSAANESMPVADYQSQIEGPIRSFMLANGLTDQIQYIVLTKGVPHRLSGDSMGGTSGSRSVDSMLATMDLLYPAELNFQNEDGTLAGTAFVNYYWRSREPFLHTNYGGYLVCRLDGYTESDAKALVDHALASESATRHVLIDEDPGFGLGSPAGQPKWYLLPDGSWDPNYQLSYSDYNGDMTRANEIISGRPGLSVQLDQTAPFVGSSNPLTGYISWGSNDHAFNATVYHSLTFAPRAIAETAVSTSGRTFLPTSGGQSLVADLVGQGVAGVKGYATEPFLDAIASPSVLLDFYSSGRNLAESFYAASRFIGWKDVVIGDPLCALSGSEPGTVAAVKAMADGALLSLDGMSVTAGTDAFGDRFYIEDISRVSGIQVRLGTAFPGIAEGMTVSVRGILATENGERYIANASVAY